MIDDSYSAYLGKLLSEKLDETIIGELKSTYFSHAGRRTDHRDPLYEEYERDRRHFERKMEEGDEEYRHQRPPLDRARHLLRQYGDRVVVDALIDILEEQEDLENIMDILEPTLQHRDLRQRNQFVPLRERSYDLRKSRR